MFPLSSFRAYCLRALGFNGFFHDSLDDHPLYNEDTIAFLLPKPYYESNEYTQVIPYLKTLIEAYGWTCDTITTFATNTYETDRCGSRCRTHILGPHILFQIVKEHVDVLPPPYNPPPISIPKWTVDTVSYDNLKPEGNHIAYHIHLHEAAFPTDFMDVHNRLKNKALETMRSYYRLDAATDEHK